MDSLRLDVAYACGDMTPDFMEIQDGYTYRRLEIRGEPNDMPRAHPIAETGTLPTVGPDFSEEVWLDEPEPYYKKVLVWYYEGEAYRRHYTAGGVDWEKIVPSDIAELYRAYDYHHRGFPMGSPEADRLWEMAEWVQRPERLLPYGRV